MHVDTLRATRRGVALPVIGRSWVDTVLNQCTKNCWGEHVSPNQAANDALLQQRIKQHTAQFVFFLILLLVTMLIIAAKHIGNAGLEGTLQQTL